MNHGSLFSGIGGFDLASEWMGWINVFHCEIEDFPKKILKHYWPNSISYDDIKQTDFTIHRGQIDILTGGFPCQPYSQAGKRLGKEDERHLWPEMLRAIREIKPRWIVGENVYGLVNWSGGLVFEEVQSELENEGYEVQPYILPACAKNAPHRRDRVWFIAYSNESEQGDNQRANGETKRAIRRSKKSDVLGELFSNGPTPNTNGTRQSGKEHRQEKSGRFTKESFSNYWRDFPTVSPILSRNDGLSERLDNITFFKWRNESIKGAGNAVVPQVVFEIFKTIEKFGQI